MPLARGYAMIYDSSACNLPACLACLAGLPTTSIMAVAVAMAVVAVTAAMAVAMHAFSKKIHFYISSIYIARLHQVGAGLHCERTVSLSGHWSPKGGAAVPCRRLFNRFIDRLIDGWVDE